MRPSSAFNKFFSIISCKSTYAGRAATISPRPAANSRGRDNGELSHLRCAGRGKLDTHETSNHRRHRRQRAVPDGRVSKAYGEVAVSTPFGKPSDKLVRGKLGDIELVFLPRHGKGHRWLPTEVNFRANIFAMKKLGVERIISVSAVGSLRAEIAPGHLVVPDQFIDRTTPAAEHIFWQGAWSPM